MSQQHFRYCSLISIANSANIYIYTADCLTIDTGYLINSVVIIIRFLFVDFSSVRVSLIAAPKTDALNFENNFIDAGSNASNSSRASTVFSYPWDLPPPQSDHSSSSTTPPCPLKWATLQRHLTEYENQSKHRDSTLRANSIELRDSVGNEINDKQPKNGLFKLPTVLLNEVDIDPIERVDDDKVMSAFFPKLTVNLLEYAFF